MKHIVKQGRKIIGFTWENKDGFWFAFGKPSQSSYLSFACSSIEDGKRNIEKYTLGAPSGLKIGDVIHDKEKNCIGVVMDLLDRGYVRTDSDGVRNEGHLEKIKDEKELFDRIYAGALIAPSTTEKINKGMTNLLASSKDCKYF